MVHSFRLLTKLPSKSILMLFIALLCISGVVPVAANSKDAKVFGWSFGMGTEKGSHLVSINRETGVSHPPPGRNEPARW
jgi:hypothetical protein